MDLIIQCTPEAAAALRGGAAEGAPARLSDVLARHQLVARPQHPDCDDPTLSRYFVIDISDTAVADRLLDQLRALPFVEAAYLSPDALPP